MMESETKDACFNLKKINRAIVFKSQCNLVFIGSV